MNNEKFRIMFATGIIPTLFFSILLGVGLSVAVDPESFGYSAIGVVFMIVMFIIVLLSYLCLGITFVKGLKERRTEQNGR